MNRTKDVCKMKHPFWDCIEFVASVNTANFSFYVPEYKVHLEIVNTNKPNPNM